jgi:hypothetical protein
MADVYIDLPFHVLPPGLRVQLADFLSASFARSMMLSFLLHSMGMLRCDDPVMDVMLERSKVDARLTTGYFMFVIGSYFDFKVVDRIFPGVSLAVKKHQEPHEQLYEAYRMVSVWLTEFGPPPPLTGAMSRPKSHTTYPRGRDRTEALEANVSRLQEGSMDMRFHAVDVIMGYMTPLDADSRWAYFIRVASETAPYDIVRDHAGKEYQRYLKYCTDTAA